MAKRAWAWVAAVLLAGPAVAQNVAVPAASPGAEPTKPPIDRSILHVQVILDHLGFTPGILDGRPGQALTAALRGFQASRGLSETGEIDRATLAALHPYAAWRPTKTLRLTAAALAGPFVPQIPHDEDQQAKLPALGYRDAAEKLGEMFHTTPEVIAALNPAGPKLEPGATVVFPNALPTSRAYDAKLPDHWRQTLTMLNVSADQPQAAKLVVSKRAGTMRVYDAAGKLVAQFNVTTGSTHDPLPIGTWKIYGADYNPKFHYNPKLFWDAKKGDTSAMLPPGPNGPVGVVWIDISKPHYGLHGTPEPQLIGRTESHGCVRLANWDAARLALMVKPGVPAVFTN